MKFSKILNYMIVGKKRQEIQMTEEEIISNKESKEDEERIEYLEEELKKTEEMF
jgi:hypothetical protein